MSKRIQVNYYLLPVNDGEITVIFNTYKSVGYEIFDNYDLWKKLIIKKDFCTVDINGRFILTTGL